MTAEKAAAGVVLMTLGVGQFLMTLDSSVMNVSIAYVANDLGTTVTGIQTAITLYTLVMATLMITGGKIGAMIGRRRAYAIGCIIYGAGSLTTALSPNLPVLILGWSFLEGAGAALIMPATVALVAGNFPAARRPTAYGLIAAAGAMAVAAGPLIGGAVTTFASWRWVFAGEVALVLLILVLIRKVQDTPVARKPRLDLLGVLLSILSLSGIVLGVLKAGEWGLIKPKPGGVEVLGISPALWLILGGLLVLWLFLLWERRLERRRLESGDVRSVEPLIRPSMLRNRQLDGGLLMFLMQYLIQMGTFFVIPLFLSVVLALNAIQTGLRLIPLSLALLVSAMGVPKLWPTASPRRIVRVGLLLMLAGLVLLIAGIDLDANAGVVAIPLLLLGLGMGALASQLGAVTVSAVPDEQSAEVGGLQNTAVNLGASLGTALAGAVLIASLTGSFISGIQESDDVPDPVKEQTSVQLSGGIPFLSDADLEQALKDAGATEAVAQDVMESNRRARIEGLDAALGVVALMTAAALFCTGLLPKRPPGAAGSEPAASAESSGSSPDPAIT